MTARPASGLQTLDRCPLCSGSKKEYRWTAGDAVVYQCLNCSLLYLDPCLGPEAMAGVYESSETLKKVHAFHEGYYEYGDLARDSRTRREFAQGLALLDGHRTTVGRRLLDVGFGNGMFLAMARERGWEVSGIETSATNVESAKRKFSLDLWQGNFETLDKPEESFDAVVLLDVVEHQPDPHRFLNKAHRLLAPGGLLLLAVPNNDSFLKMTSEFLYRLSGRTWTGGLEKVYLMEHVAYYNLRTLKHLAAMHRFEALDFFYSSTDLKKYRLGAVQKAAAAAILFLGRVFDAQNRLIFLSRKV